jgi:hypothetical protein
VIAAIIILSPERFVIARSAATKQSRVLSETLDCFASLAMTGFHFSAFGGVRRS